MTTKRQAKRKLSDIDFGKEDAHIALVSKTKNGGPANGADYALIMKAANHSPEFVEKVQQITVTMELPDFLSKFFYLWEEDADALATLLGYVEPVETAQMEAEEAQSELDKWMSERFSSYEIMKSLKQAEDIHKAVSELTEEQHLNVIADQKSLEDLVKQFQSKKDAAGVSGATKSPKGRISKKKEIPMSQEDVKKDEPKVEMVEKAQFESIEKALTETKELLKAAQEQLVAFQAKEKEAITKARFAQVKDAVGNEEVATVLFKAIGLVEDQAVVEEVVKDLNGLKAQVEQSDLFKEVGASAQDQSPAVEESGVTKLLKAQFAGK